MKRENKKQLKPLDYSKKERLVMAMLTALTVSFIFCFFGVIDIYANNMDEFEFCFKDFIGYTSLFSVIVFTGLSLLLYLFRSYLINIITAAIISVFVSSIIDLRLVNRISFVAGEVSSDSGSNSILAMIVYIVLLFAFSLLSIAVGKRWKSILIFLSILFLGMNGASLVTDFITKDLIHDNNISTKYVLSNKDLFTASKKENIVFIIFDRFDTMYYDAVVKQKPDFFEDMEGFTFFDSATSSYSKTFPAVTPLVTGNMYLAEEPSKDYLNNAYTNSPYLSDLKNNGYTINLYLEKYYQYVDAVYAKEYANNAENVTGHMPNKSEIWSYLSILSFNRNFSFLLSESNVMTFIITSVDNLLTIKCDDGIYYNDDALLYKTIKNKGINEQDCDKSFTFLYLHGPHAPIHLDENCNESPDATVESQTIGSFKIIFEYLEGLKKLGVYDNSTIIITADHGHTNSDNITYADLEEFKSAGKGITAGMFVKPRNAHNKKLIVSSAEVSTDNLIPTVIKDANIKTNHNYGKSVFDIKEGETQIRTHYHSTFKDDERKLILNKYEITGDAKDFSNWKLVDRINTNQTWY